MKKLSRMSKSPDPVLTKKRAHFYMTLLDSSSSQPKPLQDKGLTSKEDLWFKSQSLPINITPTI